METQSTQKNDIKKQSPTETETASSEQTNNFLTWDKIIKGAKASQLIPHSFDITSVYTTEFLQ